MRRNRTPEPHTVPTGQGPLAYMITFTTYGTRLHGDARGSVDPAHNTFGSDLLAANPKLQLSERSRLQNSTVILNDEQRRIVHSAIVEVGIHRRWIVHAFNVRRNHVHAVISAEASPESVMNTMKAWSTRRLREAGLAPNAVRTWTRHGSTRYLWKTQQVEAACRYVCEQQGNDLTMWR